MSPAPSLRTRALRYLARREHTRAELERKLAAHAADRDQLIQVLDELAQSGLLSDRRALESMIRMRRDRRGAASILHALRDKGVAEALIAAALPELKAGDAAAARSVWQKKFGVSPSDPRARAKQIRFLQSRGFDFETICLVLRAAAIDRADQ